MEIFSALNSQFISMPGPAISNNFVFLCERSDLSELSSQRVYLILLSKVVFDDIGNQREGFHNIEIG